MRLPNFSVWLIQDWELVELNAKTEDGIALDKLANQPKLDSLFASFTTWKYFTPHQGDLRRKQVRLMPNGVDSAIGNY